MATRAFHFLVILASGFAFSGIIPSVESGESSRERSLERANFRLHRKALGRIVRSRVLASFTAGRDRTI